MGIFGFGSNTVYYPGCYSLAKLTRKIENYKKILKKLGIGSSIPEDFQCCAGILINAGYDKQARKLARENLELFKQQKIDKIVTNCPLCFKTFSKDYKEMMPDWDIEMDHVLVAIFKKLRAEPRLIKNPVESESIIYHDACYLSRYSNICEQPRKILELIGYNVIELQNNRKESLCAGSCGNLKQTNPELANKIAQDFLKQVENMTIKRIVTADPYAYFHLNENCPPDVQIVEFSDIICEALKIKKS